jgi:hypothetical protein
MRRRPAARCSSWCKKAEASGGRRLAPLAWRSWRRTRPRRLALECPARLDPHAARQGCRRKESRRSGLPHGGMRALARDVRSGSILAGEPARLKAEPSRSRPRSSPAATAAASGLHPGFTGAWRRRARDQVADEPADPGSREQRAEARARATGFRSGPDPGSSSRAAGPCGPRPALRFPRPAFRATWGGGAVGRPGPDQDSAVSAQGGRRRRFGVATGQAQASPSPRPGGLVAVRPKEDRTARRGRRPRIRSEEGPLASGCRPPILASRLANETAVLGIASMTARRIRVHGKRRAGDRSAATAIRVRTTESCAQRLRLRTACPQSFPGVCVVSGLGRCARDAPLAKSSLSPCG